MSDAEQKPECPKCMSLRNQRLNEEVLCTEHFKKAVALLAEHSKPTQAEAKPEVTENNLGKPVDGELRQKLDDMTEEFLQDYRHGYDNSREQGLNLDYCTFDSKVSFLDGIEQLFTAHLQAAIREARRDERGKFKKLWDALGLRFGASAGGAIGVIVTNSFGESWDFQLDRDAVNELLKQINQGGK